MTDQDKYMHVLKEDLPHVMNLLEWNEEHMTWAYNTTNYKWHMNPHDGSWVVMVGSIEIYFADLLLAITYCDEEDNLVK